MPADSAIQNGATPVATCIVSSHICLNSRWQPCISKVKGATPDLVRASHLFLFPFFTAVYRSGGEVHDINTSNSYTMDIDGKTMRMSQLYQHGPGI